MYLSHPVRRMRGDPQAGETASLRVTVAAGADVDALEARIADVGTVEERLRFGALRVTVDQDRLDDLCALEGIESVETADTLGVDPGDAGEDVDVDVGLE
jgi:hypothetical protein